jgi:hypothetical protein
MGETERDTLEYWTQLLNGLFLELIRDGCKHVTEKEIAALGVLMEYARSRIDKREARIREERLAAIRKNAYADAAAKINDRPGVYWQLTDEQRAFINASTGPEVMGMWRGRSDFPLANLAPERFDAHHRHLKGGR